ncbi:MULTISPECIES: NahK/ErcS family hybrid sensor histidine kinase/response regulator [Marinobacter]|jgi:PAS domain S-box-containing protein|uniref:NahK/ErcS family hybrid sensor histidine kinase/response regulator n=1 Tax=Marinobacter TaxID=2742 RepID=UPI000948AF26|nr:MULTISPECIES: NahK/ErcS family hybrid sensor histidine kinase/response regulator [Marinobacter]MDC8456594.1 PAS domain-containing protein [Marinobacter sp. DS40M6]MDM8179431.1 PAS domain-containing protein [Marinobacter salarius]OLF85607.1 hybrid sensor histidine kinase/response regulator [Marinobacter sp. C18]RUT75890.1 PAS domain S-box protein [Marinobacter sp. NP-6]VVT21049.1 Hybrid sensor histidine kinase/response regulator [Marinobacter salarius]
MPVTVTTEADPDNRRDQRIAELEAENERLRKIRDALIVRVESGSAHKPEPYAAFEHSVVLAEQVRERTEALNQTMDELKHSNKALNRAREEAETTRQRLADAIESIADGFVLFDHQHRLIQCNSRFRSYWADARLDVPPPGTSIADLKAMAINSGLVVEEHVNESSEGAVFLLSNSRWVQMTERSTREGGLVVLYSDITDVKNSEMARRIKALEESERWIRVVTDHVPALIAYVGANMTVQFCNKVYEAWYGRNGESPLGKHLENIHQPELYQRLMPHMQAVLRGNSVNFEFEETNDTGETRYMLRAYVPNVDDHEEVIGFFVLIRDITDRRKTALALEQAYDNLERRVKERTAALTGLNSQLRQEISERAAVEARLRDAKMDAERANLSKTKFLAAVSHDLLQPLNAARLFTSSLLEHSFGPKAEGLVRSVSTSLDDVENLLGTLVDISKLDAGVIKPDIMAFDLRDLLNNIAREFRQMALAEGLTLDFVPSSAIVESDSQLLARILRNFLTNAIRYTGTGRILLGCRRHREHVLLQVWDTGPGIPEDKLTEIFQEFKRIRPAGSQPDKGLGLGLAIVDKISRMLGHEVTVSSIEGKGSVFSVKVPVGRLLPKQPTADDDRAVSNHGGLGGARIWVIDNDHAICQGMQTLLEGWDCQVVSAVSLGDLERQLDPAKSPVDLILADYHLDNDENGVDVVAEINGRRHCPAPVVMITANYTNELKQHIRELGHVLMNKPVKPLKLRSALNHLLRG